MNKEGKYILEDSIINLEDITINLKRVYKEEYIYLSSFKEFFNIFISSSR